MQSMRSRVGRITLAANSNGLRIISKLFSLAAAGGFHSFGERSVIELPARIVRAERIVIGDDVYIGAGSCLQTLGEGDRAALFVGDGTSIAGRAILSATFQLELGERVLLARNVYIADHQHAFEALGVAVLDQGITRVAPVRIGDGAWLGQNVIVGPGVSIGRGAVVGANSVVLSDVPDRAVAVGAPARVVRTLNEHEPDPARLR